MMGVCAKPLSKARTVWAPKSKRDTKTMGHRQQARPIQNLAKFCTHQQPTGLVYRDKQLRN